MNQKLQPKEQGILLNIARETLETAVQAKPLPRIELSTLPVLLQEQGASFVTLTISGNLRGCIGTLKAYQPLAKDVQAHTVAAAFEDPRFPEVQPSECALINIEISALTPHQPLDYDDPEDLLNKLKPGIHGVVLQDGFRKSTFLPQVWAKIPKPDQFLSQLCLKMGASENLWRQKHLSVYVYEVQEFRET